MKQKVPKPKAPKAPARTVNIFDVLKRIDQHDDTFYDNLIESEQKQLHPLVLTRWLSGTSDASVIQILNQTVNKYNFSLVNHKPLLMRMLLVTSIGRPRRYKWLSKSKETSKSKFERVMRDFYQCSAREAREYVKMHTVGEMIEMAKSVGWQDDAVKTLK